MLYFVSVGSRTLPKGRQGEQVLSNALQVSLLRHKAFLHEKHHFVVKTSII